VKIVYLDASSALSWILRTPNASTEFGKWSRVGSSLLFEVECYRTLERLLNERELTTEQFADAITQVENLWNSMDKLPLAPEILSLAKQRFAAPIKTLDAIHALSAQLWSHMLGEEVVLFSHDKKLNLIAKSLGLKILEVK